MSILSDMFPCYIRTIDKRKDWDRARSDESHIEDAYKTYFSDDDDELSFFLVENESQEYRTMVALNSERDSFREVRNVVWFSCAEFDEVEPVSNEGVTGCLDTDKRHFVVKSVARDALRRIVEQSIKSDRESKRFTRGVMNGYFNRSKDDNCHCVMKVEEQVCNCER